ncbi:MAG: PAS domain-containing protein [Proteobacteria bacterium]|nr:PAS domain-containing protein [Pseudomonadota bacterium]MBU1717122.1 PAS domain-containing protein [Pseudomonadota bacterium]
MEKQKKSPETNRPIEQGTTESLEFLRSAVDAVADPFIIIGTDFRVKLMNQAARNFRQDSDDIPDHPSCHKLIFGSDQPCAQIGRQCPLLDVLEAEKAVRVEYEQKQKDGTSRFYEILASPLHDSKGTFLGIVESLREITAQKQYARMLQSGREELDIMVLQRTAEFLQAKEQAELLYRVIPSAIFTVDPDRTITTWNNKAEEVTGYRAAEVLGKSCDIFALEPCTSGCGVFSEQMAKPIMGRECLIRTKDGQIRTVSKNADLLRNTNGKIVGAVESFEDITDRKKINKLLRAERDKFSSMLTALNQGMHILNRDYGIEYQNDILKNDFGDQVGRKCYEVYKQLSEPCEICRMREAISQNKLQRTELMMTNGRYYEQSYVPFTDVDNQSKVLIMLRDISKEKAQHDETMRAAQMASIGELAAGVAHEINNPINGIINYAQILLDETNSTSSPANTAEEPPSLAILPKIIGEGERIAAIVNNLLSFAGPGGWKIENVEIEDVIAASIDLTSHQLTKEGINIAFKKSPVAPVVRATRQQLQQVFLNIFSNARYALNKKFPENDSRKKIEIRTFPMKLANGNYIRTTVTDYGCGIPPDLLPHIFEPFFTLKESGQGTGLGLSISHGLIKDLNGRLTVESEVNNFTRMTVDLPEGSAEPGPNHKT